MLELSTEGFEERGSRRRGSSLRRTRTRTGGLPHRTRLRRLGEEDDVADGLGRTLAGPPPARARRPVLDWAVLGGARPTTRSRSWIDPGLAFGTGAHATTRLCLELLAEVAPGSLLDAGCGSGVLSIAAAKLGFSPVHALDDDPFAVRTTVENAKANGVTVTATAADVTQADLPTVDVAVANIALETVAQLAARLDARELVVSGYLERDTPATPGWVHVARRTLDGWAADRFRRAS